MSVVTPVTSRLPQWHSQRQVGPRVLLRSLSRYIRRRKKCFFSSVLLQFSKIGNVAWHMWPGLVTQEHRTPGFPSMLCSGRAGGAQERELPVTSEDCPSPPAQS